MAPGWRATDHRLDRRNGQLRPAAWHVVELTFEASANAGAAG
jgi:hypothetical protein